jgi:myo-inositol-1(or 4)-monophosphatase
MIETAIQAAREAGTYLLGHIGKIKDLQTKKGEVRNLVSEIDKGSEALIIRAIRSRFPDHSILAEESGKSSVSAEVTWIIDPLDGTTNFVHGVPIFSVTIGIERRGELVAGVVFDPNREELFTVEKGAGAFLNGARLHVSDTTTLLNSLIVTGFPYDLTENFGAIVGHFTNFLMEAGGIRRLGSAALDLCYVAAGRFDGYWETSLFPWDMAAGSLLVREAGGQTSDLDGHPHSIYSNRVLASNGKIHSEMVNVLKRGR